VLLIAAPLLFTDSGFSLDFTNHLWLAWVAGKALVQAGHPSYFINTTNAGVFDPWFAFYGGTLYTVTGGISELLGGHPIIAFAAITTLAIAGTYGGMLWLGRQLGLTRWLSHAPALAVITSAYYVTNLYGRGAWPEFVATSAIAPLLASGVYLARAPVWRPWPVATLAISAIFFSGSHNITLLWGTTVGALAALTLWLALNRPRRLPLRRLSTIGALALTSVSVNAWYLLPDLRYGRYIQIYVSTHNGAGDGYFDLPQVLFDPLRHVPSQSTTPALFVQIPDWFLAWALLAGVALLWHRASSDRLRRAWVGALVLLAILLGLIGLTPLWNVIPAPFSSIEFPYRLGTYVFYTVSALVLVVGLALQRAARERRSWRFIVRLRIALAAACAISVALCTWQLWIPDTLSPVVSYTRRQEALRTTTVLPRTWYTSEDYNDARAPIVGVARGRTLTIDPRKVHGDRFSAWLNVPPGIAPIQTNISAGGYLVHIAGLTRVGRNAKGDAVVRRTTDGSGPVHVVLETTHDTTIELAYLLSVAACIALVASLLVTAAKYRRSIAHS
jgi:hypothetical protein